MFIGPRWRLAAEIVEWSLAALWCVRTRALVQRIGEVPDLSEVQWDLCPTRAPGLIVVVPARDEEETLGPAMETLLAQEYPWLRIIGVDDRSTDGTGALLEALAADHPDRMSVLHLAELPEGWIAKSFAMEAVTAQSQSEYLLFTDADVWMSPSLLRRALAYAEMTEADHLVVYPTLVTKGWGERVVVSFLQQMALWFARPWRVPDSRARWDALGTGAFNLVRREAWEELGGWGPQRLAVVEDLTLARRFRAAGMRQRLVFAPGLVLVHWAPGALGVVRGLSKNFFALVNFRLSFFLVLVLLPVLLFLGPLAGLAWLPTVLPGLLGVACIAVSYQTMAEVTAVPARFAWSVPLGVGAVLWAMLRSAAVTLWRRGVLWRETFYPLRELRQHNNQLSWEWQAAKLRAERRRLQRGARPSRWVRAVDRLRSRGVPPRGRPRR